MFKQLFLLSLVMCCLLFNLKAQHKDHEDSYKREEIVKKEVAQKNREQELLEKIASFPENDASSENLETHFKLAQYYKSKKEDSLKLNALLYIKESGNSKEDFDIIRQAMTMELYHYVMKFEKEKAASIGEQLFALSSKVGNTEFQYKALTALIGIYKNYDIEKFNETIDRALKLATTDYEKAFVYLNYAASFKSIDIDSSEYYYNLALYFANQSQDSVRISATQRDYGSFLGSQSRTYESLSALLSGLDYVPNSKNYDFNKHEILKTISITYQSIEDYDKALDYIQQAIKVSEKNNYKTTRGEDNRVYGEILLSQNKINEALNKLNISYKYFQDSKNQSMLLASGSNLGLCYFLQRKYEAAQNMYDSLSILDINKSDFAGSYYRYLKLGYTLDLHNLDFKAAINKMQKSLSLMKSLNLGKERIEALKALAKAHQKINNLDQSNFYYQEAFILRDSLFNSELINTSKDLEAKYEAKEKEKEIRFLNQDNILKSKLLKQRTWALVIGAIALTIISLLLFSLFYFNRRIQKQNGLVKKALEEKDYLLREIHHRVKNNLQVVSSLLSLQSRQIEDIDIRNAINEGRSRVRSMALIHQNLYQNDSLSGVSVTGYLDNLIKELFDTYNISSEKIILDLDIEEIALDIDTMVPLGLIINELISNCLKHAFPDNRKGHISVKLSELNNQIHLTVKDNGIGVEFEKINNSKSFGKKLISAFSKKLNAEIITSNNNGTEVTMIIKKYKKAA